MSPDGVARLLLAEAEAYADRPTVVVDDPDGSLGRLEARALVAAGDRAGQGDGWPREERHEDADLTVAAYGGVFAGTGLDVGTRVLMGTLDRLPAGATEVVDLGSGNGSLTV